MKKLMITLSAAALAFGLYADGVTLPVGENFNNATAIPDTITGAGDSALSEVGYTLSDDTAGLPDQFQGSAAGKNLAIKTKLSEPAYYSPLGGGVTMEGLYFDSLVKFTACDEDAVVPTGSNAKIMVWVKEDETAGTTNLMVTAGFFSTKGNAIVPKVYDCGPVSSYNGLELDGTKWCRLTIKAYDEITDTGDGVAGFVLFVNAKTVTMSQDMEDRTIGVEGSYADSLTKKMALRNSNYALFPSMVSQDTTVTAVGFAGQGAVDDLSFTDVAPTTDGDNGFTDDPVPVIADVVVDGTPVVGVTFDTAASIVDFVVNNCKTANKVEIALTDDCDALDFTDATCGEIVIDLAGKTIVAGETDDNAIYSEVPLTIINTGDVLGSVTKSEEGEYAVFGDENVTINDGIFNGPVVSGGTLSINGGMFSEKPDDAILPKKYVWVEPVDPEIYWTIREVQQFKVILVSNGEQSEQMIPEGDSLADPGAPSNAKAWQTFIGWFDGNNQQVTFPLAITAATTLTAQFKFLDGEGTAAAPWQIAIAADLVKLQAYVADGQTTAGKVFKQTATIDLAGKTWEGIGTPKAATAFSGTYDGNGQTIKNVTFAQKEYNGLFANVAGATIKNLTVEVVGIADANPATDVVNEGTGGDKSYGAAAIVGFSNGVTIENCTAKGATEKTVLRGTHNVGGIGCRLEGEVLIKNCTNELALYTTYSKIAGFCAIASSATKIGSAYCHGNITFEGCVNLADIQAEALQTNSTTKGVTKGGSDGVAGIIAYIQGCDSKDGSPVQKQLTIKNCQNTGTLDGKCPAAFVGKVSGLNTANTGVAVAELSGNVYDENTVACGDSSALLDGLCYAQDGAYVANATALAKDAKSVLTAKGLKPTFVLQAANDYIAFDETLTTGNFDAITAAGDLTIETNVTGKVTTFTAKAAAPQGVVPGEPKSIPGSQDMDEKTAQEAASQMTATPTATQLAAGLTSADLQVKAKAIEGGWVAVAEPADKYIPEVETTKEDVQPIEVTDTNFSATIKNAKKGFYYGFVAADELKANVTFAPAATFVTPEDDGELKLTAPKATGNARFYKLSVSAEPINVKVDEGN